MLVNNNVSLRYQSQQYNKNVTPKISYERDSVSFCGKNDSKQNKNNLKKVRNFALATLLGIAGINACSEKYPNGAETVDNIKVEYFNIKPELKDSVLKPVLNLKSQLSSEDDFLDGVEIDITKEFKNLDDENSFRKYVKGDRDGREVKGISFYSDEKLPRRIIIQESAHLDDKFKNYKDGGKFTAIPALKQSIMHEVGHQFDSYFGHNHDARFAQQWDSLLYSKEVNPEMNPYDFECSEMGDKRINVAYTWNAELSDKKDFQKALLNDMNNLKNIKKENLPDNLGYYIGKFDISKEMSEKDVDYAEHQRSEVYANLFSYALGETDGDKECFIQCFPNSYDVVKSDISKYLKINLK